LNDSLSIVVPVCNAEATLARQVHRLLEVLPDLTSRLEIVLVDDASSDQTVDLARELAAQYPQLRLVRHRDRRGTQAAVRTGLQWVRGRTVLVPENPAELSTSELRRLWPLRNEQELVIASLSTPPRAFDAKLLERIAQWGRRLQKSAATWSGKGTIHMLRRDAALQLLADDDDSAVTQATEAMHVRADAPHKAAGPRRSATFLGHLRNLALGE
jgi:glycosyltransferase involved in cell wall biosynthesis